MKNDNLQPQKKYNNIKSDYTFDVLSNVRALEVFLDMLISLIKYTPQSEIDVESLKMFIPKKLELNDIVIEENIFIQEHVLRSAEKLKHLLQELYKNINIKNNHTDSVLLNKLILDLGGEIERIRMKSRPDIISVKLNKGMQR